MKKYILIITLFLSFIKIGLAEDKVEDIISKKFIDKLATFLNKSSDKVNIADLKYVISLPVDMNSKFKLKSLRYFSGLYEISLFNYKNKIKKKIDIDLINKNCKKLEILIVNNMGILKISSLYKIANLKELLLVNNNINDISFLLNLKSIEKLAIERNKIKDFSPLNSLKKIKDLLLRDNNISNIGFLSNLNTIEGLTLGYNKITSIASLSNLKKLKELKLSTNNISDISSLSNLKKLELLNLEVNEIVDITALSGLNNLVALSLENNQVGDLSPLSNLQSLETLFLTNNKISTLKPLFELKNLKELRLGKKQILELLPDLNKIKSLSILFLPRGTTLNTSLLSNPKLMFRVSENIIINGVNRNKSFGVIKLSKIKHLGVVTFDEKFVKKYAEKETIPTNKSNNNTKNNDTKTKGGKINADYL